MVYAGNETYKEVVRQIKYQIKWQQKKASAFSTNASVSFYYIIHIAAAI